MTRCEETTVLEGGFYLSERYFNHHKLILCLLKIVPLLFSFLLVTSLLYPQVLVFNNRCSFNRIGLYSILNIFPPQQVSLYILLYCLISVCVKKEGD